MQLSGASSVEISMIVTGALGLAVLMAPAIGRKPRRTTEGWLFPVKFTRLLVFWMGLAGGASTVGYAGHRLLHFAGRDSGGWASFAFGFVLVLLILAAWPEPLIFDQQGILKRGSPSSRIRWEHLAYVRQYQVRNDHGIVIHGVYGEQIVVTDLSYSSLQILDTLMELSPVPLHTLEDELAPVSILKAPIPRPAIPSSRQASVPNAPLPRPSIQRSIQHPEDPAA